MKKTLKYFLLMLHCLDWESGIGQNTNALITFFRSNWQMINPAAASYSWFLEPQKNFILSGSYRQQWMKVDNSPANYNIAFEHIPNLTSSGYMRPQDYNMKMGMSLFGEDMWQDDLPFQRIGGFFNYGYALDLDDKKQRITLGTNVGYSIHQFNISKLSYKDAADARILSLLDNPNNTYKRSFLEFNIGGFYSNGETFYGGVSVPLSVNLTKDYYKIDTSSTARLSKTPTKISRRPSNVNLLLGGAIPLGGTRNGSGKTGLFPSLWLRWQPDMTYSSLFEQNPISATGNIRYLWDSRFWIGMGLSTAKWTHAEAGFIFNNYGGNDYSSQDNRLSIGFAWDIPMTQSGWQLGQSFEITMNFTFANKN